MNLKEINQIRLRQKEVEKYTRINIMQNCTDDEILNNEFLRAAMGW